jgi:putative transposase
MIEPAHPALSIVRQCELLSVSRSGYYHQPVGETAANLALMRLIDEQFLETPWYGTRQMARHLRRAGHVVGRERVRRLMRLMDWRQSTNIRGRRCRIPSTGCTHTCCGVCRSTGPIKSGAPTSRIFRCVVAFFTSSR